VGILIALTLVIKFYVEGKVFLIYGTHQQKTQHCQGEIR